MDFNWKVDYEEEAHPTEQPKTSNPDEPTSLYDELLANEDYSGIGALWDSLFSRNFASNKPYESKVVVRDSGEYAGLEYWYVGEDAKYFFVSVQDNDVIEKKFAHTEIYRAADGKGIIYLKDNGSPSVFSSSDKGSSIVGYIEGWIDGMPTIYDCLGYQDGWFLVETDGHRGYIPAEDVEWEAVDAF